ncbi:HAAS signaling domain-containing protein [Herbiconiux flava]|uniref:DUF1700 domain-containing protein n=1 Tax=Herbiconiux flava TaxID=881268 RepID=A0A852SR72_9MICO|nr:hypothetical protein [Herbiconiux flava]NYD71282.1 hypothetical protein [Herbiconiux flava]GLK18754.1 hypothetical protein GCM10017602_32360 [Herbiconiux flava]
MTSTTEPLSGAARRYLRELETALATAPAPLRAEIVGDIESELSGLDEAQSSVRIAALGDPRAIAADAVAENRTAPELLPVSRTYPTLTAIVLTVGWYLVPVVGWIAGLVMIGIGDRWSAATRRNAILASVGGAVLAVLALLVFRATELWLPGLIAFGVIPLLVNIFVGSSLRSHWGEVERRP